MTMPLLRSGGANYIPVTDVEAAVRWYEANLGLRRVKVELDDGEGCVALGFDRDDCSVVVGPRGKSSGELTALLFTSSSKKAREFLLSRGVQVNEIQEDGQGTRFFEIRDLEGNAIEVSEEP
jgi:catechol 2,3-dioxygenase-like lactoylglutathione lyase family enzyme